MIPRRSLRGTQVIAATAIAVLHSVGGVGGEAGAATLPKDPCTVLNPAEIQTLAPGATIGRGVVDTSGTPIGVGCTYSWGPRTREWGESAITVTVIDASKAWIGVSAEQIQEGLLAKVMTSGPNASQVPGVGDAAAFTFEARSSNALAETFLKAKGIHLSVKYHSGDSLASKDKIVALLKKAVSRL